MEVVGVVGMVGLMEVVKVEGVEVVEVAEGVVVEVVKGKGSLFCGKAGSYILLRSEDRSKEKEGGRGGGQEE